MAEINFLPVCSECKSILKSVSLNFSYISVCGFLHQIDRITPNVCPVCGCMFDEITMPTELPFVQEGEL